MVECSLQLNRHGLSLLNRGGDEKYWILDTQEPKGLLDGLDMERENGRKTLEGIDLDKSVKPW